MIDLILTISILASIALMPLGLIKLFKLNPSQETIILFSTVILGIALVALIITYIVVPIKSTGMIGLGLGSFLIIGFMTIGALTTTIENKVD
ncbi:MAG: hypothetical protein QM504_10260 [Pseudomonadota bacterium]